MLNFFDRQIPKAVLTTLRETNKCTRGLSRHCDTRWSSHDTELRSLVDCKVPLMQSTCAAELVDWVEAADRKNRDALDSVRHLLNSRVFWDKISGVQRILQPLAKVVKEVQSDSFPMTKVYGLLSDLEGKLNARVPGTPALTAQERDIKKQILGRIAYCRSDVTLLACLLDPIGRGSRLSKDDDKKAQELFVKTVGSHPELCQHKQVT